MDSVAAIVMLVGAVPLTCAIALFVYLMATRDTRHGGRGDALALMMMSLLAYAIALFSWLVGLVWITWARRRYGSRPQPWQRMIFRYASIQLAIPVIYLNLPWYLV